MFSNNLISIIAVIADFIITSEIYLPQILVKVNWEFDISRWEYIPNKNTNETYESGD